MSVTVEVFDFDEPPRTHNFPEADKWTIDYQTGNLIVGKAGVGRLTEDSALGEFASKYWKAVYFAD